MATRIMYSPVLYSFRRCPYAMRARMAIAYAAQTVELREILLKEKPSSMLEISPKATVPVLVLNDQQVIDESLDIMFWAIEKNDTESWYFGLEEEQKRSNMLMIKMIDDKFKPILDQYKYAARFPENSEEYYREQAMPYLHQLEERLKQQTYLITNDVTLADIAIFPFIRQFAFVDKAWFDQSEFDFLKQWLNLWLDSPLFNLAMTKYPQWHDADKVTLYPNAVIGSER